jgi:RNA polymerase sigma-70 factor (ECF subfamily)
VPVAGVKASLRSGLNALRDAAAESSASTVARMAPQLQRHPTAADSKIEETENMTAPPRNSERAEGFDSFVEKNFPPLYRFAFCMSLAPESAAHLVQSAFAQAQRAQRNQLNPAINKHWLLTAMHHDWLAGGSRSGAQARFEPAGLTDPMITAKHIPGFDQAGVLELLHGMQQELRLVLSLFYFERLSYGEIAVILEIPPATVLAHLSDAKTVLRRQLEQKRASDLSRTRPPVSETVDSPSG